jgi:hypothetical protein
LLFFKLILMNFFFYQTNGYLEVHYNLNGQNYVNAFKAFPINDGKYHVIKFHRHHETSTLKIDSFFAKKNIIINCKFFFIF